MHRFNKDVVCVGVDCHHDVSVALLGSEWEGPRLVGVNRVGEVLNAEESFVGFGNWDVVERCFLPLILILTVSFSKLSPRLFVLSIGCLGIDVRVGVILVDERHHYFWPCCIVSLQTASMNVSFGQNPADAWYQRKVSCELGRSKMTLIVLGVTCCLLGLWVFGFLGSRFSLHIPVCWHQSDSRIGGLLAVMALVLSS
jgi:hypothetical protein